jgi:hypothetical protein
MSSPKSAPLTTRRPPPMPDFRQKCRAWPKNEGQKQAENSPKRPFFNYGGGGSNEKPRGEPRFFAKSLSVEQFLCTIFPKTPTLTPFYSYKKERKPYRRERKPLQKIKWLIFAPTFFSAKPAKVRGCDSLQINHLTQKHPISAPLQFCLPLPPRQIPFSERPISHGEVRV